MSPADRPEAYAYVDGYNLYYGLRKSCGRGVAGWRWLDIQKLLTRIAPDYRVTKIYYFTAHIKPAGYAKPNRQARFLRALATCPNITTVVGKYRTDPAEFPLAADPKTYVEVLHTEEKETDVNIALQLVVDGLIERNVENLLLVSNDSDQVPTLKLLRAADLTVGVFNPHLDRPSAELRKVASWVRPVRPRAVVSAQFPDELEDDGGSFSKPPSW